MCLQPFFVNYKYSFENSKYILDFKSQGILRKPSDRAFKFNCGHCPECWQQASTEWANRCYLESKHYDKSCVVTLTYKVTDGELHKRDYQLFLKRLRKSIYPAKIKYFCSGEYGSLKGRPHYHIIIFGYCPTDLIPLKVSKRGTQLYNSAELSKIWDKGYITVDPSTSYESCFYSAKYLQKAVSEFGVKHKQPPFVAMSKGIAQREADSFDPYKQQFIYINGRRFSIPRYFYKRFEKLFGKLALETYRVFRDEQREDRYDILNLPLYRPDLYRKYRQKINDKLQSIKAKWNEFYKKLGKIHLMC